MIVVVSPAIKTHKGEPSDNLGDEIIMEGVYTWLQENHKGEKIKTISSHQLPGLKEFFYMLIARKVYLGGSNLFTEDLFGFMQWKHSIFLFGKVLIPLYPKKTIAIGVGWWQYQGKIRERVKKYYRRFLLSTNKTHWVRDNYTASKLAELGFNSENKGCPSVKRKYSGNQKYEPVKSKHVIFTLTDYQKDPEKDTTWLNKLVGRYRQIYFFPQGKGDVEYLNTLMGVDFLDRVTIIPRSLKALKQLFLNEQIVYIGTRLHTGILAQNHGINSTIIATDNRAMEMIKDGVIYGRRRETHSLHK